MLENIKSKSVFLYDLSNEKVIYEKNPDLRLPFASITKVITAILAIEKCTDPPNTMIEMEEKVINDVLPLQPSLSPLMELSYCQLEKNRDSLRYVFRIKSYPIL